MELDERSVWLGNRLRQVRQAHQLSLEALAGRTGVSKPMLSQIERGLSNPTVATLWKIADGLGLPFATFVAEPPVARLVLAEEQTVFYEDDQRFAAYSTYAPAGSPVELFRLRLLPGCKREAEAHAEGVIESIMVSRGVLRLTMQAQATTYELHEGDAIHFYADVSHTYENPQDVVCEAQMAIFYPRSHKVQP